MTTFLFNKTALKTCLTDMNMNEVFNIIQVNIDDVFLNEIRIPKSGSETEENDEESLPPKPTEKRVFRIPRIML